MAIKLRSYRWRGWGRDKQIQVLGGLCLYLAPLVTMSTATANDVYTLYTEELPPYSMLADGIAKGLAVDIVSTLFSRAEIPFSVQVVPWQRAYVTAQNRNRSCIFPIQRTQEREAQFHWFSPIAITQTGFYTLADSPHKLRTLVDVQPLKIGTYRGSAVAAYLKRLGYDVDLTVSEGANLERLKYQRFDVWAADTVAASWLMSGEDAGIVERQLVFFTSLRSLACNLGMPDQLVEKLNRLLVEMHRDGTIEALMERYR